MTTEIDSRYENEIQVDIIKRNLDRFITIISNYQYQRNDKVTVINRINDPKSEESAILKNLVCIYEKAQRMELDRRKQNHMDINIPEFGRMNISDISDVIENRFRGICLENAETHKTATNRLAKRNILLKPNLVSREGYPESSSLDFIKSLVVAITIKYPSLSIGDGPSMFFDSSFAIGRINQSLGDIGDSGGRIGIIDFNKSNYVACGRKNWEVLSYIEIPEEIYCFDGIINLANLKEHNTFGYSCAIKNMFGLISPATRLMIHRLEKDLKKKALNELVEIFQPQLAIVDARKMMRHSQQAAYGGIITEGPGIFYSEDLISLDRKMMNLAEFDKHD